MKRKNRNIIITASILVLAGIGTGAYFIFFKKSNQVQLETTLIEKGSIYTVVTATGTIQPVKQVEVGTQVSGIIEKIYVDFNSPVKAGELLAELDKTNLSATLKEAQANYNTALNEQQYLLKIYNRQQALYEEKMISESEYDEALYKLDNAKSAVIQRQSDVSRAKTNLGYADIFSPIDGVVLSRAVDEGQTVAASLNTPTLFTIAQDLRKMQVEANVDEADIGAVKEGLRVSFTVDAFPNDEFSGKVTQARLNATVTSSVVTYTVVIEAANPDLKLMPGMTANITIFTMEKDDVITVPIKATRFDVTTVSPDMIDKSITVSDKMPEKNIMKRNGRTVWVLKDNNMFPQPIEIGVSDGTQYEVTTGLNAGDSVVTAIIQPDLNKDNQEQMANSPFMPQRRRR